MKRRGAPMKFAMLLAIAATLGGCAQQRMAEASEQMEKEKAECRAPPRTTNMALARCINSAEERGFRASGVSGGDLLSVRLASRLAIAEKQDKGQITAAEAELEFAKVTSSLVSTDQQRRNSEVTANAVSAMSAPRSTTCTRYGNSVTCF